MEAVETDRQRQVVQQVVVRFAGDSGDGMQVVGSQFTHTSALLGNDLATLPDFPAEIRAPAGTREGVSGFQLQFASHDIRTPGDQCDALIAMNPAALVTNLKYLRVGGMVVVNTDSFKGVDLQKAKLDKNPLEDGTVEGYQVVHVAITNITREAVQPFGLSSKEADRCKNFFALGMVYWLYNRPLATTVKFVEAKYKSPYKEANLAALNAGFHYSETVELFRSGYEVPPATDLTPGTYRNITGNSALAIGLVCAAQKAERTLFYGSYPITPASDVLHALANYKHYGVITFQAEDEIAAICSAIGASYAGSIGVTGTSGPGLALKAEAMNLAVMTELPLVILDIQRAGPSTGMPTKTEQADLLQAMYGRNSESPCVIVAPATPSECFAVAFDAVRIATQFMVPVIVLSDNFVANGAEPWRLPNPDDLPDLRRGPPPEAAAFQPYQRDPQTLARPWVVPGMAGYEHRIGGIEKQDVTGHISYDPENHEHMCKLRAEKVLRVQQVIPPTEVYGSDDGVLVLGWGSTYGGIRTAVDEILAEGGSAAHVHLRHLNPFPADLEQILRRYKKVLIPELNLGQLSMMVRARFLVDAVAFTKIQGQPFKNFEIKNAIRALLA